MPAQHPIKYSYESEEASISDIASWTGVSWRTAAKHARRNDWNEPMPGARADRYLWEPDSCGCSIKESIARVHPAQVASWLSGAFLARNTMSMFTSLRSLIRSLKP